MKKQKMKTLVLQKNVISKLETKKIQGGKAGPLTLYDASCNEVCDTTI